MVIHLGNLFGKFSSSSEVELDDSSRSSFPKLASYSKESCCPINLIRQNPAFSENVWCLFLLSQLKKHERHFFKGNYVSTAKCTGRFFLKLLLGRGGRGVTKGVLVWAYSRMARKKPRLGTELLPNKSKTVDYVTTKVWQPIWNGVIPREQTHLAYTALS